jgi:toxin ParE1/3/4
MIVRYTQTATNDIRAAYTYIRHESNTQTANEVLAQVARAAESLIDFPAQGRAGRIESTRELIIPETPFVLAYRVAKNEIHILALIHGARRWPEKL